MHPLQHFFLTTFLLLVTFIPGTTCTMVELQGTVYCDRCKDGRVDLDFDYPLAGMEVTVACVSADGRVHKVIPFDFQGDFTASFYVEEDFHVTGCKACLSGIQHDVFGCTEFNPLHVVQAKYFGRENDTEYYFFKDNLFSQPPEVDPQCPSSPPPVGEPVPTPATAIQVSMIT